MRQAAEAVVSRETQATRERPEVRILVERASDSILRDGYLSISKYMALGPEPTV